MSEAKINLTELRAALKELEARTRDEYIKISVSERKVKLTCTDAQDNGLEAILYEDGKLGAQFRMTHRLMFMRNKKGSL